MTTTQELEPAAVYCDGGARYDVPDSPFFINTSPKRTSFTVFERGADVRGTALNRGKRGSLSAARKLAASLEPSTIAEILGRVTVYDQGDRARLDRTAYLAEPGRRLWVIPSYGEDGYRGLGEKATATGLGLNGIEALFGSESGCWLVAFRTDAGEEDRLNALILSTVEEARERWWILSADGKTLVSGGHASRERMEALTAKEHPGRVVRQGAEFITAED